MFKLCWTVLLTITSLFVQAQALDGDKTDLEELVSELTAGIEHEREKAIALHDYVRDEIPFGFSSRFYNETAGQVLESGLGYCNTKSTLFVALLDRAAIPARQRFVDISAEILHGFVDPGTPFVDHSYVEVYLDEKWVRVDSYIVDKTLAENARQKLREEGRILGYGVHINGTSDWNGKEDAFSQFLDDGSYDQLTMRDHGVFHDVNAFYESGLGWNRLNLPMRLLFPVFARQANQRIQRMRML